MKKEDARNRNKPFAHPLKKLLYSQSINVIDDEYYIDKIHLRSHYTLLHGH